MPTSVLSEFLKKIVLEIKAALDSHEKELKEELCEVLVLTLRYLLSSEGAKYISKIDILVSISESLNDDEIFSDAQIDAIEAVDIKVDEIIVDIVSSLVAFFRKGNPKIEIVKVIKLNQVLAASFNQQIEVPSSGESSE